MEHAKYKGEREEEGEEQWLVVETVKADGELLSIVFCFCSSSSDNGECRRRRGRRRRRERGRVVAGVGNNGGQ
jgi:hypothetical protein